MQLKIAANATCAEVIVLAMEKFEMCSDVADDYSLIQVDKVTKGSQKLYSHDYLDDFLSKEIGQSCSHFTSD